MDACFNHTAAEAEFLAEDTLVTIVPSFRLDSIKFIAGEYGPFIPARPTEVPLCLAVTLKSRQMCRIIVPDWLSKEKLEQSRENEKREVGRFCSMPDHYMEVAAVLLESASDEVANSDEVRGLLQDIWDLRYAKIRRGLRDLQDSSAVKLNNLSLMEINAVRPFFVQVMNQFNAISKHEGVLDGASQSQSQRY
eukprot:Opistho-2@53415